jgi:hypothetical protein
MLATNLLNDFKNVTANIIAVIVIIIPVASGGGFNM